MDLPFLKSAAQQPGEPANRVDRSSIFIARICLAVIIVGVSIVLMFGNTLSGKATLFAWILACLLVGIFIGFLFGIPKILQGGSQNPPPAPAPSGQGGGSNPPAPPPSPGSSPATVISYQQQVNTNLTEISDWLTKIIVGLGLVNLKQIHPHLTALATILAGALDKPTTNGHVAPLSIAFAYGIIITYTILGFLFGYISTRIYLAGLFRKADEESLDIQKALSETKAAVNSANQKAEFALANATVGVFRSADQQSRAIDPANPNAQVTPGETLARLVQEYNEIRRTMSASDLRTQKMTAVIAQMTQVAPSVEGFDVLAMLKDADNGNRLSAYAYLYARPDYKYLPDLVEALTTDQAAFNQFWAIQALGKVIGLQPNATLPSDLKDKLQAYYDKLQEGWDRKYELEKIVPSLKR